METGVLRLLGPDERCSYAMINTARMSYAIVSQEMADWVALAAFGPDDSSPEEI